MGSRIKRLIYIFCKELANICFASSLLQANYHMGMTKIISEMAVFHANRSMKTNFARKFVIFHWVKQQKTISSPNVDTINICPGARGKISYVTWETIKSSIECLFCLFCWVKFVF